MRAAIAWVLGLCACGRFGFPVATHGDATGIADDDAAPHDGATGDGTGIDSSALVDASLVDGLAPGITAVHFSTAEGDYLDTGAMMMAPAGATTGISSSWWRFTGGDGTQIQLQTAMISVTGGVTREANGHIQVSLAACSTQPLIAVQSSGTYTSASGWVHILASWDTSVPILDLYINDVRDQSAPSVSNAGITCYQANHWGIAGLSGATADADAAEIYLATTAFLDLSIVANRRKFRSAAGKPVDLGAGCATPTGIHPILCNTGPAATWQTNQGFGGGFALHGNGLTPVAPP